MLSKYTLVPSYGLHKGPNQVIAIQIIDEAIKP